MAVLAGSALAGVAGAAAVVAGADAVAGVASSGYLLHVFCIERPEPRLLADGRVVPLQ